MSPEPPSGGSRGLSRSGLGPLRSAKVPRRAVAAGLAWSVLVLSGALVLVLTGLVVAALAEELHQIARESTRLPMSGQAPDWTEGTPADALRRDGLTYTARAQQGTPRQRDHEAGE